MGIFGMYTMCLSGYLIELDGINREVYEEFLKGDNTFREQLHDHKTVTLV